MYDSKDCQPLPAETTCGSLLSELQKIWDEIGEPDSQRDEMLFELQRECLDAYRRKVDHASRCRAQMRQAVADSEAELAYICATLGVRPVLSVKSTGSLKEELQAIKPHLEEMQTRKSERKSRFEEVQNQICSISKELYGGSTDRSSMLVIDESDLSLKKLEDLQNQLHALQKEKSDRLKQVNDHLNTLKSLCSVLGLDFKLMVREVHPTLDGSCGSKSITKDTIENLSTSIHRLREQKIQRMQKLQDLGTAMVELWTLMDIPAEEQQMFQNVIRHIAASENEIIGENSLSMDVLKRAEAEVLRLEENKSIKITEVLLKKRVDLKEICRAAHIVVDLHDYGDFSEETFQSGAIDPSDLLKQMEAKIADAKEETLSRREILEKVEKWFAACEEECWLEEYNRDENRYNAGRGTHLILKRAEKARVLVNKIPAMVETLTSRVKAWENQKGTEFLYDGVGLLSMLDQYWILKQEKEQERQRLRDQKKIQGQLMVEQEARFGAKPSPSKSGKKSIRMSCGGASTKRLSLGGAMLQTPHINKTVHSTRWSKKSNSKQLTPHPNHFNGAFIYTSGKKDHFGIPAKQHFCDTLNPREKDTAATRKPLSPLSSFSSNANTAANIQDSYRMMDGECHETTALVKTPAATPTKNTSPYDVNVTPKNMPIPVPNTPSTASIAMKTAMTPATPGINRGAENDYSFEERRAGFIPVKSHPASLLSV